MPASVLVAPLLAFAALAAQPAEPPSDDGPVQTAPRESKAAEPTPGLDDKVVPPPEVTPSAESPADAPAEKAVIVEQKTMVQGETLQVVLGQRAVFRLDDKGLPVLDKVEEGKLSAAHPDGAVTESFEPPPDGRIAVALDGSAEVRATILKVWNQTKKPLDYRAIALVMARGAVTPTAAPVCAVPARSVRTETWRRPVVAVGLARFKPAAKTGGPNCE